MRVYVSRLSVVAGIFILSIGVGMLVTQEGGRVPLLPDQVALTAGVYEFSWAPDGKSIAYISSQNGNSEVWVVPAAGGTPTRLTSTTAAKKHPRWSKDGKWIAYVAVQPGGAGDIQLVSSDGEMRTNLTETPADDRNPTWSPDGRQLAFTETAGKRTRIVIADIESQSIVTLAEIPASDLQWSPDGKTIVFVSDPLLPNDDRRDNEDIFVVPVGGGTPRLLTPGTPRFRETGPSWSPDSRQIVFSSDSPGYSSIFVLDTQTGGKRSLYPVMADLIAPKWSPDGSNIAFIRNEDSQFNIWTIPAPGGRAVRVSERDGVNGGLSR